MATIENSITCVVEMSELVDAALLARKLRKRGTGYMFENALITSTGSLCGGNYRDVVSVSLSNSVTFPESFAIPYEVIASAAKGAGQQLVTIGHGFLHREDGERFEWVPNADAKHYFEESLDEAVTLLDDHMKFGFDAQDFTSCVAAVERAVSRDDTRPSLCGIAIVSQLAFEKMPDPPYDHVGFDFVATDSFRMHAARLTGSIDFHRNGSGVNPSSDWYADKNPERIIPPDPMRIVSHVKNAQRVYVLTNGERVTLLVKAAGERYTRIHTNTAGSAFPNYEPLFESANDPRALAIEIGVDTNRMLDALSAACSVTSRSVFAHEPLRIRIERDEMMLIALEGNEQHDSSIVQILPGTVCGTGEAHDTRIELGINAQYLYDAVHSMGSDTTVMRVSFRTDGKTNTGRLYGRAPLSLRGTEAYNVIDGYGERCIVMPMLIP